MTDRTRMLGRGIKSVAPVALTLLLLGAALADKVVFHMPPPDAAQYHARVRSAAAGVPVTIGPWVGTDVEVPPSAVRLLRPNLIVSRQYKELRSGRAASFLLVHCEDARDLIGHYPPVCYAANGWTKRSATRRELEVGGDRINLTDYTFTSTRVDRPAELRIYNFMVLPDGQICPNMDGVDDAAQDYRRKFFGAAQVQIITDAGWTEGAREELFRQIVQAIHPLLVEIRSGVTP